MAGEIVGRDAELEIIRGFVEGLGAGPQAVILAGEAGAGKTTLWLAGVEAARQRSRVLESRPVEAEAKLAFTVLGDLLEEVADAVVSRLPDPQRRALEVALLRAASKGQAADQRAVAVGFLGALRALAADRPVVVAVDDVQWADVSSASILSFAARRLRTEPVGLLLARRCDRTTRPPLDLDRAFPEERLRTVSLGPLSLGAIHHLLVARLKTAFPRPVLRRIHETSGGNPFFALELARAVAGAAPSVGPGAALPVPERLRDLVGDRLTALPPETREAVLVAAALAQPTLATVSAAIAGEAHDALRPAVEAQIVEIANGNVRFVHPLFAATITADAEAEELRNIHHRIAELVRDPEERGRHLASATAAPDGIVAAALDDAARRARARGATDAAADLAQRAADVTPPDLPDARAQRQITAARYALEAGETQRARGLLEDVVKAPPSSAIRCAALVELARVRSLENDLRASADLFQRVIDESGADPPVLVEAHKGLASTLFRLREDLRRAEEHGEAASRLAERLGDPVKLADALSVHGMVACIRGNRGARSLLDRALVLDPVACELNVLAQPGFQDAVARMWTDDFDTAESTLRELRRRALEMGDESSAPYVAGIRALVAYLRGRLADANRYLDEGLEAALQTGQEAQEAFLVSIQALVEAQRGRSDAARQAAARASSMGTRTGAAIAGLQATWALGLLALSRDDPEETCRLLAPLADRLEEAGVGEPGTVRFVPDLIEALIVLGRLDDADRRLSRLERRAARLGRVSALAAAARCRALLRAARGDRDGAFASFEEALLAHARVQIPLDRARTLFSLGSAQRRAKQKRAARESLTDALSAFERLDAVLWVERARTELARISGRAPSADELTPTEKRVAALVAEGRTNREVASALFVTDRTVEFHLSRIYGKLGVRSRAQLARRLGSDGATTS